MAKDGKRGLTLEQRADAKQAFTNGESLRGIATRLKLRYATLHAMAQRESWTVSPTVSLSGQIPIDARRVRSQAQSNVIDMTSRLAADHAASSGMLEAISADVVDELAATTTAAKLAAQYAIDFLTLAKNGEILPAMSPGEQTVADVAKSVMAAYGMFSRTVRENAGLRPGQASVARQDGAKPTSLRIKIAPQPIVDNDVTRVG